MTIRTDGIGVLPRHVGGYAPSSYPPLYAGAVRLCKFIQFLRRNFLPHFPLPAAPRAGQWRAETASDTQGGRALMGESQHDGPRPIWVWGLPLAPLTFAQTLERVEELIRAGRPGYFITANLHYAMLTDRDPRLDAVNRAAALVLADGMPLVWASRWRPARLPERVTGSDLVPALCARAAQKNHRVFLLGGAPG